MRREARGRSARADRAPRRSRARASSTKRRARPRAPASPGVSPSASSPAQSGAVGVRRSAAIVVARRRLGRPRRGLRAVRERAAARAGGRARDGGARRPRTSPEGLPSAFASSQGSRISRPLKLNASTPRAFSAALTPASSAMCALVAPRPEHARGARRARRARGCVGSASPSDDIEPAAALGEAARKRRERLGEPPSAPRRRAAGRSAARVVDIDEERRPPRAAAAPAGRRGGSRRAARRYPGLQSARSGVPGGRLARMWQATQSDAESEGNGVAEPKGDDAGNRTAAETNAAAGAALSGPERSSARLSGSFPRRISLAP